MPFTTTSQILHDGERNVIMQFTGVGDGESVESNVVKVDVSALVPPARSVKIRECRYDVYGGLLRLLWGTEQQPVEFLVLSRANVLKWHRQGGLSNAGVAYPTGDILFSASGFGAGDSYSVTLEMVKQFAPTVVQ